MVQYVYVAWLQALWPAFLLLNLALALSGSTARAQERPLDDSLPTAGRISHSHAFGTGGQIAGTISFDGGGGPAAGVVVTVRCLASSEIRSVATDLTGHFQIDDLPLGPYAVMAEANGYEPASTTTSVDRSAAEVSLYLKSVNGSTSSAGMPGSVSVHELKVPSKAQSFFEKGVQRLDKNPADSVAYFTKAIDKYSGYYEAYYELGQAQARLNRLEDAMNSFQKAIDLSDGKFPAAEFSYGLLLCNQGNPKEAERVVLHGLKQDNNTPFGHLAMGVIQLRLHNPEEAEKSAKEVLLRDTHNPDAYLILADAHGMRKNYSAEVNDLETFLKFAPEGPRSNFARGLRGAAERLARESAQAPQANQIPQRPDVLNVQPTKP